MEGGPPCFRQDSSCPGVLRHGAKQLTFLRVRGFHPVPPAFPDRSARKVLSAGLPGAALQPHADRSTWFGLFPFRSPLLRESRLDFLSCRYLDGSLPCVCPHVPYFIQGMVPAISAGGLPHSEIRGSSVVGTSPRLFAAIRVLPRLAAPRHPPWTLIHLTILFFRFLRYVCQKTSVLPGGTGTRTLDPRLAKPML